MITNAFETSAAWRQAARVVRGLTGGLLLAGASAAHAGMILIDFNDRSGDTPTLGGVWNVIAEPTGTTALVDDTGAPTNLTVSFVGNWFDSLQISAWGMGDVGWMDEDAAIDRFSANFETTGEAVIFAGATPTDFFIIDLLAVSEFGDPSNMQATADFSINGDFGTGSQGHDGDDFDVHNYGFLNAEYLTWSNVQGDGAGEIRLDVEGQDNFPDDSQIGSTVSAARITCLQRGDPTGIGGGFQVVPCGVAVPAPGTTVLFGLGLLGFGLLRQRIAAR